MLTKSQIISLKAALTMSKANGFTHPGCCGAKYRSLEKAGLMTSGLIGAPTNKGGGWKKREYRLTIIGRITAEAL